MFRWILTSVCVVLVLGQAEDKPQPSTKQATSQLASRPAEPSTILRKPEQAEILRNLLTQQDRPVPVKPRTDAGRAETAARMASAGRPLLLEGTFLVERPGRLVMEEGRAKFVFHVDGTSPEPCTMQLLENQLLETLEREATAGFSEFIISAEVTRYRGSNYLLLRKVLRRTSHGNLGP